MATYSSAYTTMAILEYVYYYGHILEYVYYYGPTHPPT